MGRQPRLKRQAARFIHRRPARKGDNTTGVYFREPVNEKIQLLLEEVGDDTFLFVGASIGCPLPCNDFRFEEMSLDNLDEANE